MKKDVVEVPGFSAIQKLSTLSGRRFLTLLHARSIVRKSSCSNLILLLSGTLFLSSLKGRCGR
jgi:hypothetical protein